MFHQARRMPRSILWMDIVLISLTLSIICLTSRSVALPTNNSITCDEARLRCAYRTGCGMALQHYLTRCTSVLHENINECPESCQHALIALTSTDEGKDLMRCDCTNGDHLCMQSKQRVEICRSSVIAAMNRTRISCRIATWICNADALCSTALNYYHVNCKSMFLGRKCTPR
ncbi:growth arrest-specific protein 1-like [Belonocnema kinseyi]|uniref:growth arrest-specific protein 1-like n=1 Tax=Belonocnema kinseyi TaxID=2817044 RepID=UPI00143D3CB4|nr:growth arrest-specific protein 1-like [Belonocnema kinseyi]